jgi:hypothetical protein
MGGGYYSNRSTQGHVTTEIDVCCYEVFQRGTSILIARTEPVARREKGGVIAERVLATMTITKRFTEIEGMCSLLWIKPALSLYDNRTKTVRSVIINGNDFVTMSWSDPGGYCGFGD